MARKYIIFLISVFVLSAGLCFAESQSPTLDKIIEAAFYQYDDFVPEDMNDNNVYFEIPEKGFSNLEKLSCMSVGSCSHGRLFNGILFPQDFAGYVATRPDTQWGTPETIEAMITAWRKLKKHYPNTPQIYLGDISSRTGGKLGGHRSHQSGRDVDVGFISKNGGGAGLLFNVSPYDLDIPKTWSYLEYLMEDNKVELILIDTSIMKLLYNYVKYQLKAPSEYLDQVFQYPEGNHSTKGIMRYARGHKNHFHIRFRSPRAIETARVFAGQHPELAGFQGIASKSLNNESYRSRLSFGYNDEPVDLNEIDASAKEYNDTSTSEIYHVVERGETLGQIAQQYDVDIAELKTWNHFRNNMSSKTFLRAGMSVKIKTSSLPTLDDSKESLDTITHIVEPGENIWDIAKAYNVQAATIANANGIDIKKKLFPGDRLSIPKPLLTTSSITASQSGHNNPPSFKDEQSRIMRIEPGLKETESLYSNPILSITGLRILTY